MNYDENQIKIVEKLNGFYTEFESLNKEDNNLRKKRKNESFFSRFFKTKTNLPQEVQLKGIYLWGGVGCGVRINF